MTIIAVRSSYHRFFRRRRGVLVSAHAGRILWVTAWEVETPVSAGWSSTLMNWGIYATAFWLLYLSFGESGTFLQVGPAFAAAYVAGYIAIFAPAGAGIREGVLVVLLQPIMAREAAVVLAVIARLWTIALEVIPAALLSVGWRRSHRTDAKYAP